MLVHCLAGAHRAGTTGCLLLMHKSGLGAEQVAPPSPGTNHTFGYTSLALTVALTLAQALTVVALITALAMAPTYRPEPQPTGDAHGPSGAPCDQSHRRAA